MFILLLPGLVVAGVGLGVVRVVEGVSHFGHVIRRG